MLRSDEAAPTRPQPGLSDLDELLLGFRAARLQISFEELGMPRRALPAGAELTAYRIIQEALTNIMKHAGPHAGASVTLTWQGRGLALNIVDDGRGAAADPPAAGGGNGLRGMIERISLYDGSLTAGPLPGGGFRVSAFIPYSEA
ncbi:hypothetical protein StoSoilB13_12190 [Arthrobacter sp. StoSoilB13]|nr:hypothetical protein StoSoilB13_12190 [Arthrobacter sp. StoSoilB13]